MVARVLRELRARLAVARDPVAYHRAQGAEIGEGVEIFGAGVNTFGSEPYLVRVGDGVTISNDVQFVTHDGGLRVVRDVHPGAFYYAPIEVGDRVFIGAGAILLPGVSVGGGSVIGAGAVVAADVAPGTVVAGVPARPIKRVDEYAFARREEWIDTAGLTPEQKRQRLLARFSDRRPGG
jgi:acetyltransferase-like isoleucine patch superfamily enzyme